MKRTVLFIFVLFFGGCHGEAIKMHLSRVIIQAAPKLESNIVIVDGANFKRDVLKSKVPVLVYFWAPTCGPCKKMAPIVEELADEFRGQPIKIAKCDVSGNEDLFVGLGGSLIPAFMFFREGESVKHVIGTMPKEKLRELILEYIRQ